MDKELYKIAAKAVKAVYDGDHIEYYNVGSTEWIDTIVEYQGVRLQVLAIGGSDEWIDWLWNAALASWDGVKLCSYLSAWRIQKRFKSIPNVPLLVTGHSKSGPTAMYWKQKYGADYCVAFCPARGFRKPISLDNTTIFIDPDDVVPKLGVLSFEHPICDLVTLPDDPGWSISDHFIDHVIEYLN
ncbi:MAG: hypothetical protein K8S18_04935 [Desulfobacula sp.]|nr:hypothetical protein [Desulfobacula sp.]